MAQRSPDPLKEFERLLAESIRLRTNLNAVDGRLIALRKELGRKLRQGSNNANGSDGASPRAEQNPSEDPGSTPFDSPRRVTKALRNTADAVNSLGGVAHNVEDVAKILGVSTRVARLRLARATDAGLLERLERGKYRLPASEQSTPAEEGETAF